VRAHKGVLLAQKNGEREGIEDPLGHRRAAVSVLCLAGVHGERSVYALRFERWKVRRGDPVPDLRPLLAEALRRSTEAQREFEFLRGGTPKALPGAKTPRGKGPTRG
jgi:hypothetical protein